MNYIKIGYALLMHFWCTFQKFIKVHQNVLKMHQKCIKSTSSLKVHQKCIKSASKVHNQFWYSSSNFLPNLMANSWMLAATKLDQEDMKSARVFPQVFFNKSSRTHQRFLRIPSKSFEIFVRKNIKNSPHTLSQLLSTKWRCQSKNIELKQNCWDQN